MNVKIEKTCVSVNPLFISPLKLKVHSFDYFDFLGSLRLMQKLHRIRKRYSGKKSEVVNREV
jgi:hypothetical protein